MSPTDFKKMIKFVLAHCTKVEMDHLFCHFDSSRKGYITKEDFLEAFDTEVSSSGHLTVTIEDIIKPFQHKMKIYQVTAGGLFDKYDLNRNQRLSVEEIRSALKKFSKMDLSEAEVLQLRKYFKQRYGQKVTEQGIQRK